MKISELSIKNTDDIETLLKLITAGDNIKRKREALKTWRCCEGEQMHFTKQRLAELYPKTHIYFRKGDLSIVKKIRDKKTKAYKEQPIRTLSTDKQTKALETIYTDNKFERGFKESDKVYNEQKYVAVWVSYINPKDDETAGRYVLKPLRPFDYDTFRDEMTGEPLIFVLPYPQNEDEIKYIFYSDSLKNEVVYNHKIDKIISVNATTNELGLLPFGFVTSELSSNYPINSPLATQSVEWNVELSDLKTAAATQGHGQLVIKYPQGSKPQEYRMGKHSAITLPQSNKPDSKPTEASYINASPDLTGQLDILKFDLVSLLEENGITPKSSILGGANDIKSGFDRLLKESDVQDIVEENQSIYAQGLEQQVYTIIKAYESVMNNNVFVDDELQVTFQKPKVLISDKETLDNIKQRDELGLLLSWQKHQLINPNLSDKQAQELEAEIQAEKKEQIKEMSNSFNEENEDETKDDKQGAFK